MDKLLSLGIDPWSMLLYLLNTGVLLVVLFYLLYKPTFKFLDARRKQISDAIDEAKNLQETFEKELEKSEQKRKESEVELRDELSKLHKFTEEKRKELVAEMEEARAEMMKKAQKEIEERKEALIKDAEQEVKNLMSKIILDIVENKVPENVIEDSIKSAWKQYK